MFWWRHYKLKVPAGRDVLTAWLLGRLRLLTGQKSPESWDRGQTPGITEGQGKLQFPTERQELRSWPTGGRGAASAMKYQTVVMYMEIGCFVSCLCGWILVCSTLPTEYWTFSEVGSIVLTTSNYYSNLWRDCISDTTGVSDCKDYPSMLALPGRTQGNITSWKLELDLSLEFAFSQYFYTPAEPLPSAPSSPGSSAASSLS